MVVRHVEETGWPLNSLLTSGVLPRLKRSSKKCLKVLFLISLTALAVLTLGAHQQSLLEGRSSLPTQTSMNSVNQDWSQRGCEILKQAQPVGGGRTTRNGREGEGPLLEPQQWVQLPRWG